MSKTLDAILQKIIMKRNITSDYELIYESGGRRVNKIFTYRIMCDGLSAKIGLVPVIVRKI